MIQFTGVFVTKKNLVEHSRASVAFPMSNNKRMCVIFYSNPYITFDEIHTAPLCSYRSMWLK